MSNSESPLKRTALFDMHVAVGARMVPFAGYEMPVQYSGIKAEHLHTRAKAGLFDVSHMGQLLVSGADAAVELEKLMPANLQQLTPGQQRYSFFTLPNGGLLDDLIIARRSEDSFYLVVNASRIDEDLEHLRASLVQSEIEVLDQRSLLALQGPKAAEVLGGVFPALKAVVDDLAFMHFADVQIELDGKQADITLCRSGYTGEDGFELSIPDQFAPSVAQLLLGCNDVDWVGLGARDSLRLEAGLCLYGHDIDETTSPVEAGLAWCIDKDRRKSGEKPGGFLGADAILEQLDSGVSRHRAGFIVDAKVPVREGAEIVDADGLQCGKVTSGGYAPSLSKPILMAYVDSTVLSEQRGLFAIVRGKRIPLIQSKMPFVKQRV